MSDCADLIRRLRVEANEWAVIWLEKEAELAREAANAIEALAEQRKALLAKCDDLESLSPEIFGAAFVSCADIRRILGVKP